MHSLAIFLILKNTKILVLLRRISERYHSETLEEITSYEQFKEDLEKLEPFCKWTNGYWDFGIDHKIKWNELQNITRDIQILTNYLLKKYRTDVWG